MEAKEKKTILVIEDDLDMLEALGDIFERNGFDVLRAKNGEEGLDLALSVHPKLIISDLIMPRMDGITMLSKIRKDGWGKHVPVIILTNSGDNDRLAKALEIGVDEYLVKSEWKIKDIFEKGKKLVSF